jgi:hypothetical protein
LSLSRALKSGKTLYPVIASREAAWQSTQKKTAGEKTPAVYSNI